MLDIGDVARLTGLTLRALRFYEARGLVAPLRTAGGRRVYGSGELARLNAAVALKQAGFSLAEIGRLLKGAGRSIWADWSPRAFPRSMRGPLRSRKRTCFSRGFCPASIVASRSTSRPCARSFD